MRCLHADRRRNSFDLGRRVCAGRRRTERSRRAAAADYEGRGGRHLARLSHAIIFDACSRLRHAQHSPHQPRSGRATKERGGVSAVQSRTDARRRRLGRWAACRSAAPGSAASVCGLRYEYGRCRGRGRGILQGWLKRLLEFADALHGSPRWLEPLSGRWPHRRCRFAQPRHAGRGGLLLPTSETRQD